MADPRRRTGAIAEALVAARLRDEGWRILARNPRSRHGELDIVALDRRALVFIEVKAGRAGNRTGPERPILSVDRRKQLQVRRLATAWIAANRSQLPAYAQIRFDAVGVTLDREDRPLEIEHIEGAF